MNKDFKYNINDKVFGLRIVKKLRDKKDNEKKYIVQSLTYPDAPLYEVKERKLHKNYKDPYVLGRRIYEGNSFWSISSIRPFIVDKDIAKIIPKTSSKKLKVVCPICKQEQIRKAHSIYYSGLICGECSCASKPERLFIAYLKTKNIPYIYQKRFSKLPNRIFDFEIYINNKTFLVETHGEQHYKDIGIWDYNRTVSSDRDKRIFSKKIGIKLLEIDCSSNNLLTILDNINSIDELPTINAVHKKDIISNFLSTGEISSSKINVYNHKDNIKELYLAGRTTTEIGKYYKVHKNDIIEVLHMVGVSMRKNNRIPPKKVKCITTNKTFDSIKKASEYYNIGVSSISKACRGVTGYTTKNGIKYWEYVE